MSETKCCPKCGSHNIIYQREQVGNVGVSQNKVTVEPPKKTRGCLYWLFGGWLFTMVYWFCIGWWKDLLFGRRTKSGWNKSAGVTFNRTVGVCQDCGHTWKV